MVLPSEALTTCLGKEMFLSDKEPAKEESRLPEFYPVAQATYFGVSQK